MRSLLLGIDSGTQSTKALVVDAKSGKVRGIVQTVYYSDKAAKSLSKIAGIGVVALSQNVGDVPDATSYIAMFDYNVKTLTTLLGSK